MAGSSHGCRSVLNHVLAGQTMVPTPNDRPLGLDQFNVFASELRTALGQAYVGCGQSAPTFSDATLTAGIMVIKAVHITELRAAVIALE